MAVFQNWRTLNGNVVTVKAVYPVLSNGIALVKPAICSPAESELVMQRVRLTAEGDAGDKRTGSANKS